LVKSVYIAAAKRTPTGSFQGILESFKGHQLGSMAIKALQADLPLDEVIMGCVLTAAQGQAPARQASIGAGLPLSVSCSTVNKVCGSGMKAIMFASDQIIVGHTNSIIAGGMESMTNAPYLLEKARFGYRIGHSHLIDHMYRDGLEDAYQKNSDGSRIVMGLFAETTAEKYGFTREEQDQFAQETLERALQAIEKGYFKNEIAPLEIQNSKSGSILIQDDEPPTRVRPDKFSVLKPAFKRDGTITAATSSSISDGASAVWLVGEEKLKTISVQPLARIVGYASYSHEPEYFATAPIGAIQKLILQINWKLNDVDLFEINEAFAIVPMAVRKELDIPREKINIHGGACSLGHPIGSSGSRIVVTLVHALQQHGLKRGIAAICIGGGEGAAIAIELT